jgi:predicted transcriptional regulator
MRLDLRLYRVALEKESVMMWAVLLLLIALAIWGAWSAYLMPQRGGHKRFIMRAEKFLACAMAGRQNVSKEAIEKAAFETKARGLPWFGNWLKDVFRLP